MKKLLTGLLALFLALAVNAQDFHLTKPDIMQAQLIRVTPALKDISDANPPLGPIFREEELGDNNEIEFPLHPLLNANALPKGTDPALQKSYPKPGNTASLAVLNKQFAGLGYTSVNPSDNNMASGPNHVVQMINNSSSSFIRIWDKAGTVLVSQKLLSTITGVSGGGDPVVLYDNMADRWLLSEFGNGTNNIYIAVSQTNDPTGAYFIYTFATPQFPDYFKLAAWPGSYIITSNESSPAVYAIDRTKMLAGTATATVQRFTMPSYPTITFQAAMPVDISGSTPPPAGTPALIMRMADDGWTNTITDRLEIFSFNIDWVNTANTSLTGPAILATAPFSTNMCGYTTLSCVPQQGSTVKLDPLREVLMNKVSYRNFGDHEAIVCNHVTDVDGTSHAGVRWYELRKTSGAWSIFQQGTYAPDALHRWMGCIAINADGSIGLGYNVSGSTAFPSMRFTGRKACDPLGQMTEPEQTVIAGSAANASNRYGDYNAMTVDPTDGSFWFTCQYNPASTWATRVANFSLSGCSTTCTAPTGVTTSNISASSVQVNWTASGAPNYRVEYKLSSASTWTSAGTTTSSLLNVTGLSASTAYDFRVAAVCTSGDLFSAVVSATTTAPSCNAPAGLASSAITSSGATVSWTAVSGAASYDVDYKLNTTATWTNAATGTTAVSVNLSGLTASTLYDWRVRANCTAVGLSSAYTQAQFTTAAAQAPCVTAFEPNETQATAAAISSGVTNSAAISTATDIDYYKIVTTATSNIVYNLVGPTGVDYDLYIYNSAGTQIGSGTTSTATETVTLNNQVAGTYYVKVIGFSGANSATCYTIKATATAVTGCQSALDVSTNGTTAGAATIPFNTNVTGLISPSGDNDYYKFVITTGGTATVTLTTLPADYDLTVVNSAGTQLAISQNGGTTSESIARTYTPGTYYARVFGFNNANNATSCYTLKVQLGTAAMAQPESPKTGDGVIKLYPNPVSNLLNVSILGKVNNSSALVITDMNGKTMMTEKIIHNPQSIDISSLPAGTYFLKVTTDGESILAKFVKE